MKKFTAKTVPNGFFKYSKGGQVVRVFQRNGIQLVSFIDRDYPVNIKDIPGDAVFTASAPHPEFGITPEEIEGREQELSALLVEEFGTNAILNLTRENKLCVSREENGKRFHFVLNVKMEAVEE